MRPFIRGDINSFIENNVSSVDGGFLCEPCGKFISLKSSMWRHAEESHVMAGIKYQCPGCKKIRGSKNSLKVHIYGEHPDLKRIKFEDCAFRDV